MGGNSVSSAIGSSAGSTLLTGLSTLSLLNGKNSGKNQIEQLRQNTAADIQKRRNLLEQQLASRRAGLRKSGNYRQRLVCGGRTTACRRGLRRYGSQPQ